MRKGRVVHQIEEASKLQCRRKGGVISGPARGEKGVWSEAVLTWIRHDVAPLIAVGQADVPVWSVFTMINAHQIIFYQLTYFIKDKLSNPHRAGPFLLIS